MHSRAFFSLDLPRKDEVSAWRAKGKAQRDTWVVELERVRQRFDRERERSGYTAKEEEYEAIWEDIDPIEDQIVDTQAVTGEGVLVQALFFAELQKDEEQQFYDARLAKSMGVAARRMAPELAQAERLAGEARS